MCNPILWNAVGTISLSNRGLQLFFNQSYICHCGMQGWGITKNIFLLCNSIRYFLLPLHLTFLQVRFYFKPWENTDTRWTHKCGGGGGINIVWGWGKNLTNEGQIFFKRCPRLISYATPLYHQWWRRCVGRWCHIVMQHLKIWTGCSLTNISHGWSICHISWSSLIQ